MSSRRVSKIPLWLKVLYTAFLCVLVPYYWKTYGPANFLWFCDVALLVTLAAIWLESRFLASMQAIAIVVPQLLWVIDFLLQLATGRRIFGLAEYMFNPEWPLFVRGLSLFHGWLPFLLVWLVWRLGYDRRAWIVQTLAAWVLLPATYFLTDPPPAPADHPAAAVNVNWVFGPGKDTVQTSMPPLAYLAVLMAGFPIIIYFPSHLAFAALVGKRQQQPSPALSEPAGVP